MRDKFDKFSMDQIGTGEGAQAYGHGLYFADAGRCEATSRETEPTRNHVSAPRPQRRGDQI